MVTVDRPRESLAARRVAIGLVVFLLSGILGGCGPIPPPQPARHLPRGAQYITQHAPDDYGEETDDNKSLANEQVRGIFEGALPDRTRSFIRHDSRLDHVAGLLALARVWDYEVPVSSLIRWYFWREGCINQYAGYATWSASGPEGVARLGEALQKYASEEVDATEPMSYGIYQFQNQDGPRLVLGQAVVFARRMVRMKPLHKKYKPGDPIDVELQFLDDFAEPRFYIDEPGGTVLEQPIPVVPVKEDPRAGARVLPRPTFSIYYQAPERPGRYFIEITAREPLRKATDPDNPWRRSVLWLPIYVGIEEAVSPDDFIQHPTPNPRELHDWHATIVAAYDKMRADHQLPALQHHARLNMLAQDRSIDAADATIELAPDSSLARKILKAGLPANRYYQSQDRSEYVSEHIALTLLRPASRLQIMSREAPWIGIGVAPRTHSTKDTNEIGENSIVEYTVQPVAKLDVDAARKRIHERLDHGRKEAGRRAYERSSGLSAAAQTFAEAVCKGTHLPAETAKAWVGVDEKVRTRSGIGSVYLRSYEVSDGAIDRIRAKMDASADHVAVGACQGDLPGYPRATYIIVLYHGGPKSP